MFCFHLLVIPLELSSDLLLPLVPSYYISSAHPPIEAVGRSSCASFMLRIFLPSHLVSLLHHLVLCFLTHLLCLCAFVLDIRPFSLNFRFLHSLSLCNIYWAWYVITSVVSISILKFDCYIICNISQFHFSHEGFQKRNKDNIKKSCMFSAGEQIQLLVPKEQVRFN